MDALQQQQLNIVDFRSTPSARTNAEAEVAYVQINIGEARISGAAFDQDTVSAALKALLSALNRQAQPQRIERELEIQMLRVQSSSVSQGVDEVSGNGVFGRQAPFRLDRSIQMEKSRPCKTSVHRLSRQDRTRISVVSATARNPA